MRGLAAIVLVLCTALAVPARAERLDDAWAGTHWGESPESLQRHFGPRAFTLPQPVSYTHLTLPTTERV